MATSLTNFLMPVRNITKKVELDRFPEPFTIKALSQAEYNGILARTMINGELNQERNMAEIIVKGTLDPDFTDAELCKRAGTLDPVEAVSVMLLAGESVILQKAILDISGFNMSKLQEEAKN